MPNKEFLETYSLYRKFKFQSLNRNLDAWPKIRINMACLKCASSQTFIMINEYYETLSHINYPYENLVLRLAYVCMHCQSFERYFFIKTSDDIKNPWCMKIGQFPAWETSGNPNIEKMLGSHSGYYKKGLICESQGYGIGAFGYYRRIVEETIDELLSEISELLSGEELTKYQTALLKTKETTVTSEKIDLVKDLLPAILRPDGMNPLSALHSTLSQGLHAESDEHCLELAESCREILIFLVDQVASTRIAAKSFTQNMRKLLDKKSEKGS